MGTFHGTDDVKKIHYKLGKSLDESKKKEILSEVFLNRMGYSLNFDNPRTMNEKIMWLKLYYQDPLLTKCADKYAVKEYIKDVIGEQYVVPTIATWTKPSKIDFSKLPDKYVLKVNWSSGYNIIVKNSKSLDVKKAREQIKEWMRPDRNSYYQFFNWAYKHMKPVVYAEEYIEQTDGQVYDYKFYMCNGCFKYMFVATDRSNDDLLTYDFYDEKFDRLPPFYGEGKHAKETLKVDENIMQMIELAEKLAKPFPYVRVDFYLADSRLYVGEMTFYSGGGLLKFNPEKWDYILGDKITLPEPRIIDREDGVYKIPIVASKLYINIKDKAKRIRKKIICKVRYKQETYIKCGFIRIPYKTHIEIENGYKYKYARGFGIEICYSKKKTESREVVNQNVLFKQQTITPLDNFLLEGKITPLMQRHFCEQKAYRQLGYFPNLRNPRTFNEKIIWLALNYKNPEISIASDKVRGKEWLESKIGKEYVVPVIQSCEDVNDIDFSTLPRQFVVKLNDGWAADKVMIVRDKNTIDIDKVKAKLATWLFPWNNYYYQNMCITDEKMEKPMLVVEQYLEDSMSRTLNDYKFYCCNGNPCFALYVSGRGGENQVRVFVDMEWNVLPVERKGFNRVDQVAKPYNLSEMIDVCKKLSKGFPLVRVDLYSVNGKIYVGECTFTPGMFLKFTSKAWDYKFGEMLDLDSIK